MEKTLASEDVFNKLVELKETGILGEYIPEFIPCYGQPQITPFHVYPVWEHIFHCVEYIPQDRVDLRLAMLLHDIAKPVVCYVRPNGNTSFRGHAEKGALMSREILTRLGYPNFSIDKICRMIKYHDITIHRNGTEEEDKEITKIVDDWSPKFKSDMKMIFMSDVKAQNPACILENRKVISDFCSRYY